MHAKGSSIFKCCRVCGSFYPIVLKPSSLTCVVTVYSKMWILSTDIKYMLSNIFLLFWHCMQYSSKGVKFYCAAKSPTTCSGLHGNQRFSFLCFFLHLYCIQEASLLHITCRNTNLHSCSRHLENGGKYALKKGKSHSSAQSAWSSIEKCFPWQNKVNCWRKWRSNFPLWNFQSTTQIVSVSRNFSHYFCILVRFLQTKGPPNLLDGVIVYF